MEETILTHPIRCPMYILGISAFYHDSAACLVKDGRVLYAAEEERFSRIKHDNQFPEKAIDFCLKEGGVGASDLDYVAYYEKPLLKFERILETFVETYPFSLRPFLKGIPEWLDYKIKVEGTIKKKLGFKGKILFVPHHLSHAAAAFCPSAFKKAAILTIDGVGEYQTSGLWLGERDTIKPIKSIDFPNSLGLLYSTFTSFLGFKVNNDEYKVMGLAAYGKPTFAKRIKQIIDIKKDGSFSLDMKYFSFRESFQMWNKKFENLFGKPRVYGSRITKRDKDLAASIQKVTEAIYFRMLNHLYKITKTKNLCVGGGVSLNSLANGKIYENTPFNRVYIFGPSGDSGAAVGAALFSYHNILKKKPRKKVTSLYFGSSYEDDEIKKVLKKKGLSFRKFRSDGELTNELAKLLVSGKIIGWFQGRMEFGPRALGARSILAKSSPRSMKDKVNKIKKRESFRPFAGSVLQERVDELFKVPDKKHYSPFMNFVFQVKAEKRERISAIVHADDTCRIQTVSKGSGLYYKLIKQFYKETGVPCILNTSFNVAGEPIVENPKQAIRDFLTVEIDYLIIGNFLVIKG